MKYINYIVGVDVELRYSRNIYDNVKVVDVLCHVKRPWNKMVQSINFLHKICNVLLQHL